MIAEAAIDRECTLALKELASFDASHSRGLPLNSA